MSSKIVIFGGSFDPPHLGHLIMAQWVADMFSEPVRFLPAGNPPHKNPSSTKEQRADMTRLAIAGNPNFLVDEYELGIEKFTYSVDTLKRYQREYGVDRDNLYFLLGSDSFNSMDSWRQPEEVIRLCTLIVYEREPISKTTLTSLEKDGARIILCDSPIIKISSSEIRSRVKQGRSITYLVCKAVEKYITETRLYQEGE